jgi:hypothetical protein
MALILNSSLSNENWTVEPGACVKSSDEKRLLEAGAARLLTDADKPEKVFDLDNGTWEAFKAEKKKAKE